jgi:hypothetical protein
MIAAAVCELPSRLNIEFLPRNAGFSTDCNTEIKETFQCLKRPPDHP